MVELLPQVFVSSLVDLPEDFSHFNMVATLLGVPLLLPHLLESWVAACEGREVSFSGCTTQELPSQLMVQN